MLNRAVYLLSENDPARLEPCGGEVAFVGRSNVGKSTLLNALCGAKIARVSSTPGRTRSINVFSVGKDRWLVDLPGYGFARGPAAEREAWGPMIENYLTGRPSLRMVFCLVDAQVGPTRLDLAMRDWLAAQGVPFRAVATKADQVKPSRALVQRRQVAEVLQIETHTLAWVSAKSTKGIAELRNEVVALLRE